MKAVFFEKTLIVISLAGIFEIILHVFLQGAIIRESGQLKQS
jgi:hypothetical protein